MRALGPIAFAAGIVLLALNLAGVASGVRSPALGGASPFLASDPIRVSPAEFWRDARRRAGEDDRTYVARATHLVDDAVAHWWEDERDVETFGMRVPARENYLLWSLSWVAPRVYRQYEFCSAARAVERGLGLCSQVSIVLVTVLRENGVDAAIVGLDGHVVVRARVGTTQWIVADPDSGVVFDVDLATLEADPSIAFAAYRANGFPEEIATRLANAFAPDGNVIAGGVEEFAPTACAVERAAYAAKWVIPVLLLVVGIVLLPRRHGAAAGSRDARAD
jgi:hypothetical protein